MDDLQKMPNIGAEMARQLRAVGVETPQQLKARGAKDTWLAIQAIDPSACYNRLCGLEGAVQNIRWHNLPPATKAELKEFYDKHKLPKK